jgi:hypothetical protein
MASRDVTLKEWECDACGSKVLATQAGGSLLPGWTHVTFPICRGMYTKTAEVCPTCSQNLEEAKRKAQAKWAS